VGTLVTPGTRKAEELKFKDSLDNLVRTCLKVKYFLKRA
jgi:hypothetical protein